MFKQIIDQAERAAAETNRAAEGDYIKNGLIYCGKCNTPKQTRVTIFDEERTPFCLCKCETEKRDKEEAERRKMERQARIMGMRVEGFPDKSMTAWTFDKDDQKQPKISTMAHKFVDNFETFKAQGKGLLLYGTVGTGKTFISACIANALIDKGYPCLVTNFARLTNTISGMYDGKQKYIDSLNNYDLLVIDDLASERDTEYMGEIVHNIIDSRYRSNLPLIVTTNLTAEELKHPADIRKQRIYSRLFEMCHPVEVKGADRRKQHLYETAKETAELLGL